MKMRLAILVLGIVASASAVSQTPSSHSVVIAKGSCNVITIGSSNKTEIRCGIGKEQAQKLVEMMNKVLAAQNPTAIMAKLEEILAAESKPIQTQSCVGSNCVQGPNYGTQILNQYGAPKLTMTDAQRDAIQDAMRPYAGIKMTIFCHDATPDSSEFAEKLSVALKGAGVNVEGPTYGTAFPRGGGVPQGTSIFFWEDREGAANALAGAMVQSGLLRRPINGGPDHQHKGLFAITIAPNR